MAIGAFRVSGTDGAQNPFIVKAKSGNFYGVNIISNSAALFWVKVYDKATAPASTDTPIFVFPGLINTDKVVQTIVLPPISFGNGIGIRVTGGVADNDATSVAAAAFLITAMID